MKPNQRVPLTVASGLASPLPGVPTSPLISTIAMMARATIPKATPPFPTGAPRGGPAAPRKNSIGTDSTTLVRDARPPRAPAGAAAGLAGLPAAVSSAFWITILFLGQLTNHTLAHMIDPRRPPRRIFQGPGSLMPRMPSQ